MDENQYLLLNTLKEIVQNSDYFTQSLLDMIPFLFEFSLNKDESVKNILAECIGSNFASNF